MISRLDSLLNMDYQTAPEWFPRVGVEIKPPFTVTGTTMSRVSVYHLSNRLYGTLFFLQYACIDTPRGIASAI